ncbi:MAG: hypothetical protein EZS28_020777, partial [Streblomastix strix]
SSSLVATEKQDQLKDKDKQIQQKVGEGEQQVNISALTDALKVGPIKSVKDKSKQFKHNKSKQTSNQRVLSNGRIHGSDDEEEDEMDIDEVDNPVIIEVEAGVMDSDIQEYGQGMDLGVDRAIQVAKEVEQEEREMERKREIENTEKEKDIQKKRKQKGKDKDKDKGKKQEKENYDDEQKHEHHHPHQHNRHNINSPIIIREPILVDKLKENHHNHHNHSKEKEKEKQQEKEKDETKDTYSGISWDKDQPQPNQQKQSTNKKKITSQDFTNNPFHPSQWFSIFVSPFADSTAYIHPTNNAIQFAQSQQDINEYQQGQQQQNKRLKSQQVIKGATSKNQIQSIASQPEQIKSKSFMNQMHFVASTLITSADYCIKFRDLISFFACKGARPPLSPKPIAPIAVDPADINDVEQHQFSSISIESPIMNEAASSVSASGTSSSSKPSVIGSATVAVRYGGEMVDLNMSEGLIPALNDIGISMRDNQMDDNLQFTSPTTETLQVATLQPSSSVSSLPQLVQNQEDINTNPKSPSTRSESEIFPYLSSAGGNQSTTDTQLSIDPAQALNVDNSPILQQPIQPLLIQYHQGDVYPNTLFPNYNADQNNQGQISMDHNTTSQTFNSEHPVHPIQSPISNQSFNSGQTQNPIPHQHARLSDASDGTSQYSVPIYIVSSKPDVQLNDQYP